MAISISQLQRLRSNHLQGEGGLSLPQPRGLRSSDPSEFGDLLKNAIDRVDNVQKHADGEITSWVAGEKEDLHEVMISMNHAQLSFQLMTEVRNRLVDTYQELMRMQV
ncbi:MAG: flagellar hook-basal body complex protein FliE [Rhodothermales bacterium]|nr:flagellar hook-basal body complex protein FliE [Rhodothermales bacterium]MBO6780461.1 flagellar hook-basal body complex protein FliE [Rhodothermales bacterium]